MAAIDRARHGGGEPGGLSRHVLRLRGEGRSLSVAVFILLFFPVLLLTGIGGVLVLILLQGGITFWYRRRRIRRGHPPGRFDEDR